MFISRKQIEAFLMVAGQKSFTGAGKALYISQSAVSGLIKELEKQIGEPLFEHTSRRVTLSEEGRKFLPAAQKAHHEFLMMERFAEEIRHERAKVIRVVAAPLMACTLVPVLIARFAETAPAIKVQLLDDPPEGVQNCVADGDAVLGFGPERPLEAGIVAETLFSSPVSFFSRPDHPLCDGPICWDDVKRTLLFATGLDPIRRINADVGGKGGFTQVQIVKHMSTAFGLAAALRGAVLAGSFAMLLARGYGLAHTPVEDPQLSRRMVIVRHGKRKLPPSACLFLNFLREYAASHDLNAVTETAVAALGGGKRA